MTHWCAYSRKVYNNLDCQGHSFSPSLFHPHSLAHYHTWAVSRYFFPPVFLAPSSVQILQSTSAELSLPFRRRARSVKKKWEERKRDFRMKQEEKRQQHIWLNVYIQIYYNINIRIEQRYPNAHTRPRGNTCSFCNGFSRWEEVEEELIILLSEYSFNPLEIFFSLRFVAWIDRPEKIIFKKIYTV